MGTYIGFSNSVGATHGALLNPLPEIPNGAILTEDGLYYILTEDMMYSIQQENEDLNLSNAILTEDGLHYLTTEANELITTL